MSEEDLKDLQLLQDQILVQGVVARQHNHLLNGAFVCGGGKQTRSKHRLFVLLGLGLLGSGFDSQGPKHEQRASRASRLPWEQPKARLC